MKANDNDDLAREAFLKLKARKDAPEIIEEDDEDEKPAPLLQSGKGKREDKKNKRMKDRKVLQQRGALNANSFSNNQSDKDTYNLYTNQLRERVTRAKGVVEIEDELTIQAIGYCIIRMMRKGMMESTFQRFMDRAAPQDPVAQIYAGIKQLKLNTDVKGNESNKEIIGKLLSADNDTSEGSSMPSIEEWRKQVQSQGIAPIQFRDMSEFQDATENSAEQDNQEEQGSEFF